MLKKTYCKLDQAASFPLEEAIVIQCNNNSDLNRAANLIESRTNLKGIQFPSSLLLEIPKNISANFISINLTDKDHTNNILKYLTPKNQFIELIIPINLFSEELISGLEGVKRVIIDFTEDNQQSKDQLNNIFATLISNKFFPFTKGLTQDQTDLRHMFEFYQGKISQDQIKEKQNHKESIKEFLESKEAGDLL